MSRKSIRDILDRVVEQQERILVALDALYQNMVIDEFNESIQEKAMTLKELKAVVEGESDVKAAVELLIQGLVTMLREGANAQEAANTLQEIDSSSDELATAVVAGTDAEEAEAE